MSNSWLCAAEIVGTITLSAALLTGGYYLGYTEPNHLGLTRNEVCTRATYWPLFIKGKMESALRCTEAMNTNTGTVRQITYPNT